MNAILDPFTADMEQERVVDLQLWPLHFSRPQHTSGHRQYLKTALGINSLYAIPKYINFRLPQHMQIIFPGCHTFICMPLTVVLILKLLLRLPNTNILIMSKDLFMKVHLLSIIGVDNERKNNVDDIGDSVMIIKYSLAAARITTISIIKSDCISLCYRSTNIGVGGEQQKKTLSLIQKMMSLLLLPKRNRSFLMFYMELLFW